MIARAALLMLLAASVPTAAVQQPPERSNFDRILAARGITHHMDEMGVEAGCTVLIGSAELEWQ